MRLSSRNEWILVAILIAYIAFVPPFQTVRDILATSVGKAAALAGIVYVYKFVSCPAALLLLVAYVRCAKTNIWEGMDIIETPPKCTGTDVFNPVTKVCEKPKATSTPESVGSTPSTAAPASTYQPGPLSTAPITVPGAGMPTTSGSPIPPTTGGPQPGAGTRSGFGSAQ